jgi:CheY-like chemotaxis protein
MNAETVAHVFEPFFTTKEHGKGTGLGLATVYGITRQSGGHVVVRSEPGHGSSFEIYLPAIESEANERDPDDEEQGAMRGDETLLLVEDENALRRLSAVILRTHGYRVLEADGPKSALRLAAEHQGPIHALLTDVVMPEMSGPRLAERLTAEHPDLRVLFISGYSNERALGPEQRGNGDLLQKPFRPSALVRAVWRTLHR